MKLRGSFLSMLESVETGHAKAIRCGWESAWYIVKGHEILDLQRRGLAFAEKWPLAQRARRVKRARAYLAAARATLDRLYDREPAVTAWGMVWGRDV